MEHQIWGKQYEIRHSTSAISIKTTVIFIFCIHFLSNRCPHTRYLIPYTYTTAYTTAYISTATSYAHIYAAYSCTSNATYESLHASATTNPHIHTTLTFKVQHSQLLQCADPRQLFRAFWAEVIPYTTCTQHTLTIHITAHMHYKYTFAHSAYTTCEEHWVIVTGCLHIITTVLQ